MERKKERKGEKREDPKKSRPRRVVVLGFGGVGSRKGRAPRSGRTAGAGTTTRHLHHNPTNAPRCLLEPGKCASKGMMRKERGKPRRANLSSPTILNNSRC